MTFDASNWCFMEGLMIIHNILYIVFGQLEEGKTKFDAFGCKYELESQGLRQFSN